MHSYKWLPRVPLSLHILTGRSGTGVNFFGSDLLLRASTLRHEVERSIVVFVLGGVLERFPRLRVVSAENNAACMPYLMWRMDAMHSRLSALAPVKLSIKPSDYIKRQVYATFINEPVFIDCLHRYPTDNIMWSSDYPHTAASWPRSQQFIESTFSALEEGTRRKIVHDTAARVYGLVA